MNAPPGNYTVWITGGSGSLSHFVQLTITVKAASHSTFFTIGANPSSLSIPVSSKAASSIGLYGSSGYEGNISLTATPFPLGLSASFDRSPVRLSGTQVTSSTLTLQGSSPGYYSVNVTARDGVNAHSISLDVQVYTEQIKPGPTSLMYDLGYTGSPYPGGSIILVNNFTDLGIVPIRVSNISIYTDFGSFKPTGTPFTLTPGHQTTLQLTTTIPQTISVGIHTVIASISWQYSNSSLWVDQPTLSVTGHIAILQTPNNTLSSFFTRLTSRLLTQVPMVAGILAYLGLASIGTLVFARHDRTHRLRPTPRI